VSRSLTAAGFSGVQIDDVHLRLLLGGGLALDDAVAFLGEGGMGKRLLGEADPPTRERALAAVREALVPHATAEGVRLDAAVWMVRAGR